MVQLHQTSLEVIQAQLVWERTVMRLLVRPDACVITSEEEIQLQELRQVKQKAKAEG